MILNNYKGDVAQVCEDYPLVNEYLVRVARTYYERFPEGDRHPSR